MLCISNKIKVVIPARYGSTRLPGKPLADICGVPMIVRVCNQVSKSLEGVELVVAVDDERVKSVVEEFGYCAVLTKIDCKSGTDRVAEVAKNRGWSPDSVIINVQGDEPLIPSSLLSGFVKYVLNVREFEMGSVLTSFDCMADVMSPHNVKVVTDLNGCALYFSRAPIPLERGVALNEQVAKDFKLHVGIYGYTVRFLQELTCYSSSRYELKENLEQLRVLENGRKIMMYEWEGEVPHGVDTLSDLEVIRRHVMEEVT